MFLLHVEKNKLAVLEREPVTSGSVNAYAARFEFSENWEGLNKTAVFQAGCASREVLLGPEGACVVPWEVMRVPGYQLKAGVYGKRGGEVVLPTVWASLGVILEGVPAGGSPPPSPELWEQELTRKGDGLGYTEEGELGLFSGDKLLSSVPFSGGGGGPGGQGLPGKSAYDIAVDNGFEGTEEEWLDSLQGKPGRPGANGSPGPKGEAGVSPKVSVTDIPGGHRVTITDVSGPHSFDVMDGENGAGGGGSPIGTVISFMGTSAPTGYLICDGAEYEIPAYPALAKFFERQFGTQNHFGGNGTDTFAVPDLRNLFLRGYHGEAEEQLSGEIGARQEATVNNSIGVGSENCLVYNIGERYGSNFDTTWGEKNKAAYMNYPTIWDGSYPEPTMYTARPVNMAVLYCIKATNEGGSGGSGSAEIESYDTSDGWHVRKWSDGYMEQSLKKELTNVVVNVAVGSLYNTGQDYGPYQYPEPFSELYGVSALGGGKHTSFLSAYYAVDKALHLTKTPGFGIYRPKPVSEGMDYCILVTARGRWK